MFGREKIRNTIIPKTISVQNNDHIIQTIMSDVIYIK